MRLGDHRAEFVIVPDHYPSLSESRGSYDFSEQGTGTLQTMTGDVAVHVLVLGRQAEKGLVKGFEQFVAEQAELLEAWDP